MRRTQLLNLALLRPYLCLRSSLLQRFCVIASLQFIVSPASDVASAHGRGWIPLQ